ncbi:acyltransferase family protein [Xanthomonas sp. NCPPB 1638]|uniref:acyltransferase family protein n=1 Tax=Xanthomonas TaxID=338 RepID=UPI00132F21E4|nr:acyltransferase family protein [Xanthomonas cucurbitae]QHG86709.1 acyltransferase [Xanthomonas cucurbitae]WDM76623.1 acyltransferase [Xanthomonas cucurbitae]
MEKTAAFRAPGSGYFAYIDGLRAIAVLAVIVYHLDADWLPGGFTGVDVFFVISGFVVSASVDRLPRLEWPAELARFYARRLRRIAPALVVCLIGTALVSALFIPKSWLSEASSETGRMAFVGFSNWVLAAAGHDYFSPRAEFNQYTQTWSLGIEEQFYLLFPWMFLCWRRGGSGRLWSLGLFVAATAISLGYAWLRARSPDQAATTFYLTTARFWQLGVGVVTYQALVLLRGRHGQCLFDRGISMPAPLRALLLLTALTCVAYGLRYARPGHSPWSDGAWPVLGASGLLLLLHRQADNPIGRLLSAAPMLAVGRLSYSLYLWHWPVLVVLRWTIGLDAFATKMVALLLTCLCAIASYRWVELPWRHRRLNVAANARLLGVGVGALVLAAGVQLLVIKTQPYTSLSVVSRNPGDWYAYARGLDQEIPDCELSTRSVSIGGWRTKIFSRGTCVLPVHNHRQIFVLGDSHALSYSEMLRRFTVMEGGSVRLYGAAGCAIAPMTPDPGAARCRAFVRQMLDDVIANARPGDVLFLPGLRVPRLAEQDQLFDLSFNTSRLHSAQARAQRQLEAEATITLLEPVQANGVHIVLEAPKPVLKAPAYRCSDWFNRDNPICVNGMQIERSVMERYRAPALDGLRQIVVGLERATLWDPLPLLCDAHWCTPALQGRPLFFDADHVSGYGNRVLLPDFTAHLRALPAQRVAGQ